jgi:hypothetical protein
LHPQETTVTLILLLSRQPYNQVSHFFDSLDFMS